MRQTLFTPTYNRKDTLPRLYQSIKRQTFKDFVWLIVDDGSSDGTQELVLSFIKEGLISIRYIYKDNGGKHTAMKMAWEIADTPYLTSIDSDEELLPSTMEIIENEWISIEKEGNSIGRISLFMQDEAGEYVGTGSFKFSPGCHHIDSTWQEIVYDLKCNKELMGSVCLAKLKESFSFEKYTWHSDTNRYLMESIIWANFGRHYRTRLLNQVGGVYYFDANNSILRGEGGQNINSLFNKMTNACYKVDENVEYFWRNPKSFISSIATFIILGVKTKTSIKEQWQHINSPRFKRLYLLLWVPFYLAYKMRLRDY